MAPLEHLAPLGHRVHQEMATQLWQGQLIHSWKGTRYRATGRGRYTVTVRSLPQLHQPLLLSSPRPSLRLACPSSSTGPCTMGKTPTAQPLACLLLRCLVSTTLPTTCT